MPTQIIEKRFREAPCCGGNFLRGQMIMGSGTVTPCTPTIVDVITDGTFDNPAAWPWQQGTALFPQIGAVSGGKLIWPGGNSDLDDYYFQAIPSLVSTRDHTLTVTRLKEGLGDPQPTVFIFFQSSDGYYTFHNLSTVNGTDSILITAGAPFWNFGPEGAYFPACGLGPTDYGALIVIQEVSGPYDGGNIDDFSFTYEECI